MTNKTKEAGRAARLFSKECMVVVIKGVFWGLALMICGILLYMSIVGWLDLLNN